MRRSGVAGVVLVALLSVGACSSSGSSSASSSSSGSSGSSSGTVPEDLRATDAEVAAGLGQIDAIAKQIAVEAGIDKAGAQDLSGQIEPIWSAIEGTVKANDVNTYLAFEDAFALLESAASDGDSSKAQTASTNVSASMNLYLAAHPA